jgi:MFS family permease
MNAPTLLKARADAAPVQSEPRLRANVLRLATATALGGANSTVIFATGSIIGAEIAPDPALATLPISMFVVGLASGTLPIGWISRAYGRRAAFYIGCLLGAFCGALATVAISTGAFALFCVATFCGGLYAAVVQSYRFAAADGASPAFRAKAVAWVLTGGIFAGIVGPQLVQWTMSLSPHLFAASYVGQGAVALLAIFVLAGVHAPRPAPADLHGGRPLSQIVLRGDFLIAALCGVVSYALMNFVMTSAPLAMRMCGHSLTDSNLGIQWHVIAMYGPSFVTGSLIARFGAKRIVALGLALEAVAALIGLSGITVAHFWSALVVLGIGWNFGFVGASALVLETHTPPERNKVQAFNDFLIFGTMAVGSFSSGQILANSGWSAVNLVVFPPIAIALAALLLTSRGRRGRALI